MQGATGEAAPRQMAVDDGKTQGDGPGRTKILLHPGQQAAQFLGHGGAIAYDGKGTGLGHGRLCFRILEQNRNKAKVPRWNSRRPVKLPQKP
jgi:hypothetical protein